MRYRTPAPAALVLAVVGSVAHAGKLVPRAVLEEPKERRYASTPGASPLPGGIATLLTTPAATLAKGLKKRVLVVDATSALDWTPLREMG